MPNTKAQAKTRKSKKSRSSVLNVAFVIDMSGSMAGIRNEAIEGANTYLRDLKDEKDAETTRLTFIAFDDQYEVWNEDQPVTEIEYIGERYMPRGMTALHDAIAKTIGRLDQIMVGDRAEEKALVVVLTDGYENASVEYRGEEGRKRLADLVDAYEARGNWTFVYLGANDFDVKKTAVDMGFAAGNAAAYTTSARSVGQTYSNLSAVTNTMKGSSAASTMDAFSDAGVSDDERDDIKPTEVVEPRIWDPKAGKWIDAS